MDRSLILAVLGLWILVAIPLWLGKVKQNRWYGFRTPKTLSSADVWYRANRFAGAVMVVTGILGALLLTMGQTWLQEAGIAESMVLVATLVVTLVASLVYLRLL